MGTFWAIALMLEHLGCQPEAARVMAAMQQVVQEGKALTRDIGGNATTAEMTDAILARLWPPFSAAPANGLQITPQEECAKIWECGDGLRPPDVGMGEFDAMAYCRIAVRGDQRAQ